ncbi:thyrotropin-releasing hormone receptor [Paragonimus westermani]|uniref:Thyrotropin-releasing hormone receptor n=1 Tax=Paragonimus westermani TaxID=34504 RepID=A0A5J4P0M0_9TREM|nr:thyrotropin-releasing hormone receptor [Paragonimus westermani]
MPFYFYSIPYRIVGTLSLCLILLIGLIGNLVVLVVVIFSPGLHTPTNCYLVSLSSSDLLVLLSTTLLMIYDLYIPYGHWNFGKTACRLSVCVQYLTVAVSVLSICAFSVERWLGICYPLKAHYMCTVNRAVRIITGIWVFATLHNIPWMFIITTKTYSSVNGPFETCVFESEQTASKTVYTCDFIFYYAFPLCITVIMYAQIGWHLYRDSKPSGMFVNNNSSRAMRNEYESVTISTHVSHQQLYVLHTMNRMKARKQVSRMLRTV